MGKSVIDVFRNTALDEFVRRALIEAKESEDEIVMYRNEEIILHVYAKALPQKGWSNREGIELLLVFNDLTKIRQLERVRKDFVANVSHELKTPLTLIKGFVETLSESTDVEPEQLEKFLKIIDKHTHRLIAIIDDLLSLSKLESGEEKVLNFTAEPLKPILMQASGNLRSVSRKRGIMVALRVEKNIKADVNRQLIEQAVVNLLDNSLKYSEEGSTVLISAGEENSEVWISIKDEGCGIPLMEQERIFERFYRVDKARSRDLGGTGLGLSIVNHIVQLHKGKIDLDSVPGRGSTFTIRIPKRLLNSIP
jgi:two-component system phosphate regulon sensor histidine kinase PhoR